jgi:hypothetical protein
MNRFTHLVEFPEWGSAPTSTTCIRTHDLSVRAALYIPGTVFGLTNCVFPEQQSGYLNDPSKLFAFMAT